MVFRDIPGKLVQWRRQSQRLRRLGYLRRAPVNSPGDGIAWVPVAPLRLRLLPASGLTFRRVAGPLPVSCSQTRPEPPAADRAWSLPGLWHRDDLSLSSRAGAAASAQNAWVTFGEHRWVSFGERRRKWINERPIARSRMRGVLRGFARCWLEQFQLHLLNISNGIHSSTENESFGSQTPQRAPSDAETRFRQAQRRAAAGSGETWTRAVDRRPPTDDVPSGEHEPMVRGGG